MKYCPYCGAGIPEDAATFCTECGKPLSTKKEDAVPKNQTAAPAKDSSKEKKRKPRKAKKAKQKKINEPIPEVMGEAVPDDYDGYYNDVLTPDLDRVGEGLDKELIKKVAALMIGVIVIIGLCVAMLYIF